MRAFEIAGVKLVKHPEFASWTATCFRCGLVDGLQIARTAMEGDLYPVKLWCSKCRNIPITDIPSARKAGNTETVVDRAARPSASGESSQTDITRDSPDGRACLRVVRTRKSSLQNVTVLVDGVLVAGDSLALMKAVARAKFVETLPEDCRQWAGQALLECADILINQPELASEDRAVKTDTIVRENDPYPEAIEPEAVLDSVKEAIERHLALPEYGAVVLTLWIALTYFMDALSNTPYLLISSPVRGCGKTLVLEILELLASRPFRASNMTGAALFRGIEMFRPTLLLDEIDTMSGPRLDDVTGILNDGFQPNGKVVRVVGENFELKYFSVYCPKALAGIGKNVKSATRSRCINLPMHRALPHVLSGLKKLRTDKAVVWSVPLASKLARFGVDFAPDVRSALQNDEVELPPGIEGRDAQLWEGLIAVADHCGERWALEVRAACVALTGLRDEEDVGDAKTRLLSDVRDFFRESSLDFVSSADLLAWLVKDETRGWGDVNGRDVNPIRLASMLKPFDAAPRVRRVGASNPKRLWSRAEFALAWSRYLPPASAPDDVDDARPDSISPKPATPVTPVTNETTVTPTGTKARRATRMSREAGVTGVTAVTGSDASVGTRNAGNGRSPSLQLQTAIDGAPLDTGEVVYGFPD